VSISYFFYAYYMPCPYNSSGPWQKEGKKMTEWLNILDNICDLLDLPFPHIYWATWLYNVICQKLSSCWKIVNAILLQN
jgi:hypothetical protein